jgi:hypothetical protein
VEDRRAELNRELAALCVARPTNEPPDQGPADDARENGTTLRLRRVVVAGGHAYRSRCRRDGAADAADQISHNELRYVKDLNQVNLIADEQVLRGQSKRDENV